jgi:hypothetical protein
MLTDGIKRQISVTIATRMIVIVGSDIVDYKLKKLRCVIQYKQKQIPGLCPPANYTDRTTAACRRS